MAKVTKSPKLIQHVGAGIKTKYRVKKGKAKITGVPVGKTKKAPGKIQSSLGLTNVGKSERFIRKAQKHAQRESKYEQKLDIAKAELDKFTKAGTQYSTGAKQRAQSELASYKSRKSAIISGSMSSGKTRKQALLDYKTGKKRLKADIVTAKKAQLSSAKALKYAEIASKMRTKYEAKLKRSNQKKRAYESAYSARMTRKAEKRKYYKWGKQAGKPIINELAGVKLKLGNIEVKLGDEKVPLNVLKPEDITANPKLADDVLKQFPVLKQFATKRDPMFDFTKFDEKHKAELAGKILEHTRNPMPGMENFPAILKDINETAFANYKDTQTPYGIHKALEAKRLAFEELRSKRKQETAEKRQQALDHRLSINFTGQMPPGWAMTPGPGEYRIKPSGRPTEDLPGSADNQSGPEYESTRPFSKRDGEPLGIRNPLFENYGASGVFPGRQDFSNLAGYGESPSSTESLYSEADTHPEARLKSAEPEGLYSAPRGPAPGEKYNKLRRNMSNMRAKLANTTDPEAKKALEQKIMDAEANYAEIQRETSRGEYMDVAGKRLENLYSKPGSKRNPTPESTEYLNINPVDTPYYLTIGNDVGSAGGKSGNNTYMDIESIKPAKDAGYIEPGSAGRKSGNNTYMDIESIKPAKDAGYIEPGSAGRKSGNNTYMTVESVRKTAEDAGYLEGESAGRKNVTKPDYMTIGEARGSPVTKGQGEYFEPDEIKQVADTTGEYMEISPAEITKQGRKPMPTTPAPPPPFSLAGEPASKREQNAPSSIYGGPASKRELTNQELGPEYLNISPARSGDVIYADPKTNARYRKSNTTGQYMNVTGARKSNNTGQYMNVTGARKSNNTGQYMNVTGARKSNTTGQYMNVTGARKNNKGTYMTLQEAQEDPAYVSVDPRYAVPKGTPVIVNVKANNSNQGPALPKKGNKNKKGKSTGLPASEYASLLPRPNTHNTYIESPKQKEEVKYMTVKPASPVSNVNTKAGYIDPNKLRNTSKTGQYMKVDNIRSRNKPNNAGYMSVKEMRNLAKRNKSPRANNSGYLEVAPADG